MASSTSRYEWIRPGPPGTFTRFSIEKAALHPPHNTLRALMREIGVPRTLGVSTPEEDLVGLLRAGTEIEHGLMIQYLFAGYSIASTSPKATRLLNVAIEEMGHWLTVQNLLLAAGAFPWLARYDETDNEFAPFPFRLEAATPDVIAEPAFAEVQIGDSPALPAPIAPLVP